MSFLQISKAASGYKRLWQSVLLILCTLVAPVVLAVDIPLFNIASSDNGQQYGTSLQILLLLSALSFLPALLLVLTSFTRIIVVLSLLRQALGLQQSPPNPVLVGLALFMTLFIMKPVFTTVWTDAVESWMGEQLTFQQAVAKGSEPFRAFMLEQTYPESLKQMADIAGEADAGKAEAVSMTVLIPAFVISELKTAFQIGFMLFIPFLVIDLLVASVLMAMGMVMLSPLVVSLPFKLLLFVLVDGWTLLTGSLVASY